MTGKRKGKGGAALVVLGSLAAVAIGGTYYLQRAHGHPGPGRVMVALTVVPTTGLSPLTSVVSGMATLAGQPAAGVTLYLRASGTYKSTLTTFPDGKFSLSYTSSVSYTAEIADATGVVSNSVPVKVTTQGPGPGSFSTIVVTPLTVLPGGAIRFSGTLVDTIGAALAGWTVNVTDTTGAIVASATTLTNGTFVINTIVPLGTTTGAKTWVVKAAASTVQANAAFTVSTVPGGVAAISIDATTLTVPLNGSDTIFGKATDSAALPVRGLTTHLFIGDIDHGTNVTSGEGNYSFMATFTTAGTFPVYVKDMASGVASPIIMIKVGGVSVPGSFSAITVAPSNMPPTNTTISFNGKLFDTAGVPMPNWGIELRDAGSNTLDQTGTTDALGNIVLSRLITAPAGTIKNWYLLATGSTVKSAVITVTVITVTTETITLNESATSIIRGGSETFTGNVKGPTGANAGGVLVHLIVNGTDRGTNTTSGQGNYSFTRTFTTPGTYTATVTDPLKGVSSLPVTFTVT